MKKFVKILIILFIIILVIASIIYIDYFSSKTNNTSPKISIKEENENSILYKSFFYKVYYCKTNKKYVFADYDEEVVCPNNYNYKNDYYTNSEGIKISKKDLQLLTNDGLYTGEMIEALKSEKQVKEATNVAYNFGVKRFKVTSKEEDYNLVIFPTFELVGDNYDWVYNEEEVYCLKGDNYNYQVSKYEDGKCEKYEKVKMSEEWCNSYKTSTLIYVKGIENLCK